MGRGSQPPVRGDGAGAWQEGEGCIYGRQRQVRWRTGCLWWVAGARPVKVVVAEVEGYRQRFQLVSSATE